MAFELRESEFDHQPSLIFFGLPRELRDEIYKLCCTITPRRSGPLQGYVDVPNPTMIMVNRQMYEELKSIFYSTLKNTLSQDQVCLQLGPTRYAGWHLFRAGGSTIWKIWTRDGIYEDDVAAWWVDTLQLSPTRRISSSRNRYWPTVLEFDRVMGRLSGAMAINNKSTSERLEPVRKKVQQVVLVIAEAELDDERQRRAAEEAENVKKEGDADRRSVSSFAALGLR